VTDLVEAGLLALGFVAILLGAELWHRRSGPPVEVTRKLVHLASGLPVLFFPWIFQSTWPVLGLSGFIAGILAWARHRGMLRSVHGVERSSRGELLYPLGIVLLFWMAHDQPVLYLVSVLVLIVSDPAAALIGSSYGRSRYEVEEHWRSWEGSLAFFLMTFLAVHLPLVLMAGLDPSLTVLVGLVVALLVTLFEAVSLNGADNLVIPLASYLLLQRLTAETSATVGVHLGVLLALLAGLGLLSLEFRFMKASGVMAATLFFYVVYALAGPAWLVPPVLGTLFLVAFRSTIRNVVPLPDARYQVVAISYATLPTLALVGGLHVPALASSTGWSAPPELYAAALAGSVAGQLAIMCATQLHPFNPSRPRHMPLGSLLALVVGSWAVVVPASLPVMDAWSVPLAALAAGVAFVGAGAYWYGRAATAWPSAAPWNFRLQAAAMTGAGVAAVAFGPALAR
jgi:dolichol kinase